jgi:predicted exporter
MTRPLLLLFSWVLLIIAGIIYLRGTVSVTSDLTQFLPRGATQEQKLAVSLARTGPASRLIIIALGNAPAEDLANISRRMVTLLEKDGLFSHVSNGGAIALDKLEIIFRYRYLFDPGINAMAFSEQSLHHEFQQRLVELGSALPLTDIEYLQADPIASFRKIITSWRPDQQQNTIDGVWFTPDGQRALIVAITKSSGFDPQAQEQAIHTIHAAFSESDAAEGTNILLSGTPVFANNSRNTIRSDLKDISITAGILVALFLLMAYRSPYLLILSGMPVVTGLLAGAAITSVLFGNIHGITLVFGITLLGVAIDYPIHLFSHMTTSRTPLQTMLHIWPTLRLGVITTCIGYLAFARQDFNGLAQLGAFTITGLLTAAAMSRWFLPSLIISAKMPGTRRDLISGLKSFIPFPRHAARFILIIASVTLVLLLSFSPPEWETDLSALSPLTAKERQLNNTLRNAIGAPDASQLIVMNGADSETVLRTSEEITGKLQQAVKLGLITGFDAPTRYLPSMATQKLRQASLPDSRTARQMLTSAIQGLPYKQDAFNPFLEALSESKSLPPLTLDDMEDTLIGSKVQTLLTNTGQEWQALILLSGIASKGEFQNWWSRQQYKDTYLLDLKEASTELLTAFRNSTLDRLLLGILLIVALLSVGLRSLKRALRILFPVILAAGLVAALLGGIGERLSLFHLIALLLTVGIGIDYSLFFHRPGKRDEDKSNTTHALSVCAVSTVTVFGILATSPIPVLHAIGLTAGLGVPLCFFLASAMAGAGKSIP